MTNWEPPTPNEPCLPPEPRLPPSPPEQTSVEVPVEAAAPSGGTPPTGWRRRFWKIPLWGWGIGVLGLVVLVIVSASADDDAASVGESVASDATASSVPASTGTTVSSATSAPASTLAAAVDGTVSSTRAPDDTSPATSAPEVLVATLPPADTAAPVVSNAPEDVVDDGLDRMRELLAGRVVADADPARSPYERDEYDRGGWGDFDGDCISTRHELLITYSRGVPTMDPTGCYVESGLGPTTDSPAHDRGA